MDRWTPASRRRCGLAVLLGIMLGLALSPPGLGSQAQAQSDPSFNPDHQVILERVQPILQRVVSIRGLAPTAPIPAGVLDRHSLREVVLENLAEEISPERWRIEEQVLQRLGILGPDTSYRELMLEILASQIAGYYDDESKQLFLIDDLPLVLLEPTMAHELFHGIQDQRWGISTVTRQWETADDAILAYMALVEGDAVGVMIDYVLGPAIRFTDIPNFQQMLFQQIEGMDMAAVGDLSEDVPRFLTELLLFPYLDGLGFVHHLQSVAGWSRVDQAYLDPPLSTEQVMHPERYLERDEPTWVTLDLSAIEAQGFDRVYDQVFGEFVWSAVLGQILEDEVADRAVSSAVTGWDGDRLVALEGDDGVLVLVAVTVWDDQTQAKQFHALLRRAVETVRGESMTETRRGPTGVRTVLEQQGCWIVLELWGDMVLYLDGAPEQVAGPQAESWLDLVWTGRSRSRYPSIALRTE